MSNLIENIIGLVGILIVYVIGVIITYAIWPNSDGGDAMIFGIFFGIMILFMIGSLAQDGS